MRAELKTLIASNFDERTYWPEDIDNFAFGIEATIGPEGQIASEIYQFEVCTPRWIETKMINRNFGDFGIFGRNLLIVKEYDWDRIRRMISDLCARTTGENWEEISIKLSRFGHWEFEDYQSTPPR